MHNLKHNKVLHDERAPAISVATEDVPRVSLAKRFEIEKLSEDFTRIRPTTPASMQSPRVPAALAQLRKTGLKYDIMTTSFFLGRRSIIESAGLRKCPCGRTSSTSRSLTRRRTPRTSSRYPRTASSSLARV